MQFLFQPLTWGFLLIGVPILVHLITMLRHRKQKWAAMDFLLESYRRNRRWVMLKQWLLLASRILAMILLVVMLAKWVSGSQWLSWLGGQTTHHYVLFDDSYSMGEEVEGESVYQRALQALNGLVGSIAESPGQHQITLLRWSRASLALAATSDNSRIDGAADLFAQSVPSDPGTLLDRFNATEPTALQLTPSEALELITPMVSSNADQASEVYVVTDMRRNEFANAESLRNQLQTLDKNEAKLHLIYCAQEAKDNLSIVSIEPEKEVWAVGVPLMVRFQVRNRSERAVKNLVVRVRSISYAQGSTEPQSDQEYSGEISDLPPVAIEQLAPGETVSRQVQVIFGTAGSHVIEASIPDDSLADDNRRWCTIGIQQQQDVLLVDDDPRQLSSFFVEKVLKPAPQLSTGMKVEKVDSSFLRDSSPMLLGKYDVIALLDLPRLDPQSISTLEEYCRAGGGLLLLAGGKSNTQVINEQLYRDGNGLFPVKLGGIREVVQQLGDLTEPNVTAVQHPVLGPLLQLESSPFFNVQIRKFLELEDVSSIDADVEVVARGIGGAPLILDHPYGSGRVMAVLSGLESDWSNWAQDPTFVVLTLRSLGYLASFQKPATSRSTGTAIALAFEQDSVLPEAEVLVPARDAGLRVRLQQEVKSDVAEGLMRLDVAPELESMDREILDCLLRAGIFETWTIDTRGERSVQNFAHNVAASEGDLEVVSPSEFEQSLRGLPMDLRSADSVSTAGQQNQGIQSTFLLCFLGLLLLFEQMLAYSASYHAPALGART